MSDDSGITDVSLDDIDLQERVYKHISTYLVALIAGIVFEIIALIEFVFGRIEEIIASAGGSVAGAADASVSSLVVVMDSMTMVVVGVAHDLGPFGPIVIAVAVALFVAASIRVLRAVMDSIPVVSGIQTFLEGR